MKRRRRRTKILDNVNVMIDRSPEQEGDQRDVSARHLVSFC